MSYKDDADDPVESAEPVECVQAEEPIEHRLLRAYVNGFRHGAERASWGQWDHS